MPAVERPGGAPAQHQPLLLFLFLLYIAVACLALTPLSDINAPKWFLIRAVAPVLFLAALLAGATARNRRFVWDPLGLLGVAFLLLHVVSTIPAVNPGYAAERSSNLAGLLATFFLAAYLGRDRRARFAMLWMLLTIGAVTSAYGIAQHHGYDFSVWQRSLEVPVERGVSFFGHATFTASVLIQLIPIGAGLAAASRWPGRVAAGVLTIPMLYHLSFSGARMANLAFLISVAAAGLCWLWQWRTSAGLSSRTRALQFAAAGLLVVAGGAIAGGFVVRAWQVKGSDVFAIQQSSLALRIYNWQTASRMIYAHPLGGVGAGNYAIVSPSYWNDVERMRTARHGRWMQEAHNEYLQTAAELGLPGVAILLALFAYAAVMALETYARADTRADRTMGLALFAAVLALGVDANTTFSLQAPGSALVFWVVLGLISAAHRAARTV
jgi:O-antigen ligase